MADTEESQVVTSTKIDPAKVKSGDIMAFVYWGMVKDVQPDLITIDDLDRSMEFSVQGDELISTSKSADQYSVEEAVTKTKAAEILIGSVGKPLTIKFTKQDGKERALRGRLLQPEPLLGRSYVEDLDVKEGSRVRLVDHRTIKYLIVGGTKYIVK